MKCPKCGSRNNKVIESIPRKNWRTRRRKCVSCGQRFTTKEILVEKTGVRADE